MKSTIDIYTFQKVYSVATRIEDDLAKNKANKPHHHQRKNNNKKGSDNTSSSIDVFATSTQYNSTMQYHSNDPRKRWSRERRFTQFLVSYKELLEKLNEKGLLTPIVPTPLTSPEKRNSQRDDNVYCAYNRGIGHDTERSLVEK